jgi:hypothetical protein
VTSTEVRHAWNGEISLAYQVIGDGPLDLLYMQGNISNGVHTLKGVPDEWRLYAARA